MGNTLLDFHHGLSDTEKDLAGLERVVHFLRQKGVTMDIGPLRDELYPAMLAEMDRRSTLSEEIAVETFLDPFLARYQINFAKQEKIDFMRAQFSCFAETVKHEPTLPQTLQLLRQQGFRLVVLSNVAFYPEIFLGVFEALGLVHYFERFFFSYAVGTKKPSPVIFQHALQEMNISARHAFMVGDKLEKDILPAKALGMGTIWIPSPATRARSLFLHEKSQADFVVENLKDIPKLFALAPGQ